MAWTAKFTGQYGKTDRADIAIGAGGAEAQHDTISINLDVATMGKREAVNVLEKMISAIESASWPVN